MTPPPSNDDIVYIRENMATKADLATLATNAELVEMRADIIHVEEKIDNILERLEALVRVDRMEAKLERMAVVFRDQLRIDV